MAILGGIGKDAGSTAATTLHDTVGDAGQELKEVETIAVQGIAALIQNVASRLNGAELPIDITITIKGKLGPLGLSDPTILVGRPNL